MARRVRENGVTVWTTIYNDEGHQMPSTTPNNNFMLYTWIEFAKRYLLN